MINYKNVQNMSKLYIHQQSVEMEKFVCLWITKFNLNLFFSNYYSDLGIEEHV